MKRLFVTIIMLLAFLPISAHGLDQDPHKGVAGWNNSGGKWMALEDDIHNITLWWYEHTNR